MFLSEILSKSILEEEKNKSFYDFIKTSLIWLDSSENFMNFHIQFITKLLKHLGVSPDISLITLSSFDIINGVFCRPSKSLYCIQGSVVNHFKEFLGTDFDAVLLNIDSSHKRKELLEFLMKYMQFHLPGFKRPLSLNIMYDLFKK